MSLLTHLYSVHLGERCQEHTYGKGLSLKCWGNWTSTCRVIEFNPYAIPHSHINAKWAKDLNMRCEVVKLIGTNGEKP